MSRLPPGDADVAVVGAGVLGCSIAWHIVRRRPGTRVAVIDRERSVATQASSQAAGLLTRARTRSAAAALVARTYAALGELAYELAQPPPIRRNGTLAVASSDAAAKSLDALAGTAAAAGLRVERPDPRELPGLVPWLDPAGVRSCAFMPDDGFIDPYLLTDAYARAARARGAVFRLGLEVLEIEVAAGRVRGLTTAAGTLRAPVVATAAGAWTNRLTLPLGFGLPMAAVRSHYWITEPDPRFRPGHPTVVLPDARAYARSEVGALLFGLREAAGVSLDPDALPRTIADYAFADDPHGWQSLVSGAPAFRQYCPALDDVGIRSYVAGVSTYTPDGLFLAGPVPGIAGLFAASGCCGAGVAASGGLGLLLAELILDELPSIDPAPVSLDRFGAIDPRSAEFRARCAAARSAKAGG
ncbi:MAG: FAD-binding oxidoreductase [Rhodospirillales bacterium]|jgi:glycine/D-amino acid oxidase-like deaminating enzyme|nr:FAD-binding oxidoreductase [Rhodospirillales bacterium]